MSASKALGTCFVASALMAGTWTSSARAEVWSLLILLQLDKTADTGAVRERVRTESLANCLVANVVPISSDQLIAKVDCDDGNPNSTSLAVQSLGKIEKIQRATTFSISRLQ